MSEHIETPQRKFTTFEINGKFFTYPKIVQDLADGIKVEEFEEKYPNKIKKIGDYKIFKIGNYFSVEISGCLKNKINNIDIFTINNKLNVIEFFNKCKKRDDGNYDFSNYDKSDKILKKDDFIEIISMLHFLENREKKEIKNTKEQIPSDIIEILDGNNI